MSFFLIGLALLIALAMGFVLPALLRRPVPAPVDVLAADARRANLKVLREQLAALDAEHAAGALDAQQYQNARTEIERRALEEETQSERPVDTTRAGRTAVVVGLFVPFFALLVYALVGAPQAMLPQPGGVAANAQQPEVTQAQVEEMVAKLAQRLESKTTSEAGDLQGWVMLARSYGVLQRYPEASRAYARARALAPDDAQLLADHADVLAMVQGQRVSGEPQQLVAQALKIDPRNLKALALAGSAAYETKDFAGALQYWERAKVLATPGSEFLQGLESGMKDAREALAGGGNAVASMAAASSSGSASPAPAPAPAPVAAASASVSAPGAVPVAASAPGAGSVSGVVQIAGALASKVAPTDTVFIFARAENGPRMPLAILKRSAKDLPLKFSLDDSSAMSPEMKLSNFPRVVIGARISRSGEAMPRTGDLTGQVGPVGTGSGAITITIDSVQP